MGLDITVVMADWDRLARIPADERLDVLDDAVFPDIWSDPDPAAPAAEPDGWVWPPGPSWCARYQFHGTTGAHSFHWHLAAAWADIRQSAAPDLRGALDQFLGALVPEAPADGPAPAAGFPDDPSPWYPHVLLLCAPDEIPGLARAWETAAPRLEELRAPFDAECAGWAGRPATFDAAAALLHEWGEVVAGAESRGWGLIGLR
ncbi:hypothetical protein ACFWXO_16625 [Kitasatospora sp. NPDC059088]|uniref:hypothetical protein n=1 Tax=Kitasatospora sp. NPDC059088 TaxID=3346722 RepID=UPI0036B3EEDF